VILFARTKENVINLSKFLERSDVGSVRAIHSNKSQNARINALNDFRDGQVRILISTDVTARGIDVDNISHVINFDVPVLYEDYIHRIGRTGRALKTGIAITFSTEADLFHISKIEKLMGEKIRRIKLPESILIEATPFHEAQKLARELDRQKKINDPTFKGAFHERKK
jgi:ATP-dependent RNA helicase RhlE